jgi:hypothetical protein
MITPAADPPALVYQHPGASPYKGTSDHAFDLLYPAAAPYLTRESLAAVWDRGYCRFRAWHQGEIVDAMVYGHGQVSPVAVDVNDWPPTASRLVLECTDGAGNAVLLPRVCGNWSFERVPPFPYLGGPPVGEGWTPVGEASQGGFESGFGYGQGAGIGLFGGGAAVPGNIIPASLEAGSSSTGATIPSGGFETAGTPGSPGGGSEIPPTGTPPSVTPPSGGPPPVSTPEPGSFAILLSAVLVFGFWRQVRR